MHPKRSSSGGHHLSITNQNLTHSVVLIWITAAQFLCSECTGLVTEQQVDELTQWDTRQGVPNFDTTEQQAMVERQKSDTTEQQAMVETQKSDTTEQQTMVETQKSDTTEQQAMVETQKSDTIEQQAMVETHESDTTEQQAMVEAQKSDTTVQQAMVETQKSDTTEQQAMVETQKSDTTEQQAMVETQKSDTTEQQAMVETQKSDTTEQQAMPRDIVSSALLPAMEMRVPSNTAPASVVSYSTTDALSRTEDNFEMEAMTEKTSTAPYFHTKTPTTDVQQPEDTSKQKAAAFVLDTDCLRTSMTFKAVQGFVYEIKISDDLTIPPRTYCRFEVEAPAGTRLFVEANRNCTSVYRTSINIITDKQLLSYGQFISSCTLSCNDLDELPTPLLVSASNHLYLDIRNYLQPVQRTEQLGYAFKIEVKDLLWTQTLPVVRTSPHTGFVTSLGYDGVHGYPKGPKNWAEIDIAIGDSVMVSFPKFDIHDGVSSCDTHVELSVVDTDSNRRVAWEKCRDKVIPARVYRASRLLIKMHVTSLKPNSGKTPTGFKMLFSFHAVNATPVQLADGVFNCSVDYYPSFQQHLDCNLEPECDEGQDETQHCPFSSAACRGKVASANKCYFYASSRYKAVSERNELYPQYNWEKTASQCSSVGGQLAVIKNEEDLKNFNKLFHFGKRMSRRVCIGIVLGWARGTPAMYRKSLRWADKTLIYYLKHLPFPEYWLTLGYNCFVYNAYAGVLAREVCDFDFDGNEVICESNVQAAAKANTLPIAFSAPNPSYVPSYRSKIPLVRCPYGHVTHTFLSCDFHSHCGVDRFFSRCSFSGFGLEQGEKSLPTDVSSFSVAMFECDDDVTTIPYTLVCDFKNDCEDKSDESFCRRLPCQGFQCSNGQCVSPDKECNVVEDCQDRSDEVYLCSLKRLTNGDSQRLIPPPAAITFNGEGGFINSPMQPDESCAETHYRCPGQLNYCLPVYTRCNGFYDCLGREDEVGCEEVTCPGFFRCRASSVCVHPDHLCDGWPQCPQRDDELLCGVTCPDGCLCQGLSFLCHVPFDSSAFPELRYLDATGSGMTLSDVKNNDNLICLILSKCGITYLTHFSFRNLQILDLRENKLTSINMSVFLSLENLKHVYLSNNPIILLTRTESNFKLDSLETIDFSQTRLSQFDSRVLAAFHPLQQLNLSFTDIHCVGRGGFSSTPQLVELDLRGSPVEHFPVSVFSGLTQLRVLVTPNYRLCCENILPEQQSKPICVTQESQLSSCERLLRSRSHQLYTLIVGLLALTCNALFLVKRNCFAQDTPAESGLSIVVTNLSMAKFITGVYLGIVSAADLMFKGSYLENETRWKSSVVCMTAGVLSLLSSETSLLMVFLLTLDRFTVLHFPSTQLRFGRRSAMAASLMTWLVASTLSLVPVLPGMSHWELYGQSGICTPVFSTQLKSEGQVFWFGIQACFNLSLGLVSLLGQSLIYRAVHKDRVRVKLEKTSEHIVLARRLMSMAVTDILTYISLGIHCLFGFVNRTQGSEQAAMIMAVYVMPLTSALNPVLYVLNVLSERSRVESEARLLSLLKSRVSHHKGTLSVN